MENKEGEWKSKPAVLLYTRISFPFGQSDFTYGDSSWNRRHAIAFGCAKVGNDLTFQSSASFSNTITFHSVSLRLAHLNSCKNFPWSPDNIPRLNIQKGYFKEGCLYSDCRGRLCHLTSPRGFPLVTFCLFISALLRGPLFSCNQPLRTNQEAKKSRNARPLPISFTPLSANRRADRGRASCQF